MKRAKKGPTKPRPSKDLLAAESWAGLAHEAGRDKKNGVTPLEAAMLSIASSLAVIARKAEGL